MKASEVLQEALRRIEEGRDVLCCLAINGAANSLPDPEVLYLTARRGAQGYLNVYKPASSHPDGIWWPATDTASRIAALKNAINDAIAAGD